MTRRGPIELAASDVYSHVVRWDGRGWRGELRDDIRIVDRRTVPARSEIDAAIKMYAPSRADAGPNRGMLEAALQDDVADGPMTGQQLKIAELWQRESAAGRTYYSGYLGQNRIMLFCAGERDHPKRPGERVHVWNLVLQPKDEQTAPRQQTRRPPMLEAPGKDQHFGLSQPEPPAGFFDDSEEAVADLMGARR
jgi:hypothetical protein